MLRLTQNKPMEEIHSHPYSKPKDGNDTHNDFPSYDKNIYGGDRIAMELFGYSEMFIVPYDVCEGTPKIIVYSDRTTWCIHNPYFN